MRFLVILVTKVSLFSRITKQKVEMGYKKRDFVQQLYVNFSAAKVVQFVQFAIISNSILMFINKL